LEPAQQLATWPEGGAHVELGHILHALQLVGPHDRCDADDELGHGQVLADAPSRAAAERQVGVAAGLRIGLVLAPSFVEAIRIEALRVGPDIGVVVDALHVDSHDPPGRHLVAADARRLTGMAHDRVPRRVQAQGIVDDLGRVLQMIDVGVSQCAIPHDPPDLVSHALLCGVVSTEKVQRERQCRPGSLVPGDEERQCLVTHRGIIERLTAVGIAGPEQQGGRCRRG